MKLKLKLDKRQTIETKEDFKVKYIWKPTLESWKKKLQFTIVSPDPRQDLGDLGIPEYLGDTIIIEMIHKEEQKTLEETGKKESE